MQTTEEDILEGAAGNSMNTVACAIVLAGRAIAFQLKYLGNGDAATQMGAIEALGAVIEKGIERLAEAINDK